MASHSDPGAGLGVPVQALLRFMRRVHAFVPARLSRDGYALPPWQYYFELTRRCNLRCQMCQYLEWLNELPVATQRAGELTTEEWARLIDDVGRSCLITFTGGEVFLRPDFPELLARASRRCATNFITNGLFIDAARAEHCVALAPRYTGATGLYFVGISVDGPRDSHNSIRRVKQGYERSMHAVSCIAEARRRAGRRYPMVHITTVVQADNIERIPEMPALAKAAGADIYNLTLEVQNIKLADGIRITPRPAEPPALSFPRLDPVRVASVLAQTRAEARNAGIELRTPDMPDEEIVKYYAGRMNMRDYRCDSIWSAVGVAYNGDVYTCWQAKDGNVRERPLREIFNSAEHRAWRRFARDGLPDVCAGCCFNVYNATPWRAASGARPLPRAWAQQRQVDSVGMKR